MGKTSIMFSGLLLFSGIIWECSSTTLPTQKNSQVGPPSSDPVKNSENNNYSQQTPWRPIVYPPVQTPTARISVASHPNKYFTPIFPKNTVNFKIDSMGYPMDVKTFTDPGFKKYQGPKLSELNSPRYDEIMSRLNSEQVPKLTPNTRSTRESYDKPYDFTKSTEFNPKKKLFSPSAQFPVNPEFPSHSRGFSSKRTNFGFGRGSFNSMPNEGPVLAGYKSSGTMKIPQLKVDNSNSPGVKSNEQYQLLTSQPQLHFQSSNFPGPVIYPSLPFQRIRADVEVINKKRPSPAPNTDDDKSEEDVGSAGDSLEEARPPSPVQNPFDMPESNIFESYDQAFGNYSNRVPKTPEMTPGRGSRESGSVEDERENLEYEESNDSFGRSQERYEEDEEEAETKKNERRYSEKNSDAYKNYGADFERDFEESYKREVPRETYKHVKEVPDIEEPVKNKNRHAAKKEDDDKSPQRIKKYYKTVTQRNAPKQYDRYVTYHSEDPAKSDSESRATDKIIQQNLSSGFGSRIVNNTQNNSSKKIQMKIHNQQQRSVDNSRLKASGDSNERPTRVGEFKPMRRIMVDVDPSSENPPVKTKPPYPGYYDEIYKNRGWQHVA